MRGDSWRDIYLAWISQHLIGLLTWAQTLAASPRSGGNNPTIDAGDSLVFDGLRDQPAVTVTVDEAIPATPVFDVAGADIVGAVGAASTSIQIGTGAASALAAGDGPSSGIASVVTGPSTDGAGTAGTSGLILIRSGSITSAGGSVASGAVLIGSGTVSGGTRRSGEVLVKSGDSTTTGATGNARFMSGDNTVGNTGQVRVQSGLASAADSGATFYGSGDAPAGISGGVNVGSGAAGVASGAVVFRSGDAAEAGPVDIYGGLSSAAVGPTVSIRGGISALSTGGPLALSGGEGPTGRGDIEVGTQDTLGLTGTIAQRVAGRYTEWNTDGFQGIPGRSVWQKKITCQVATTPAAITDDPDFEFQNNHAATAAASTPSGLSFIQSTGSAGDYSVVRTDQTAGVSSWGKANLARGTRYVVGGTVSPSVISGRYEVGARPTTNAFDDTTDDNKTILVYDPAVSPNWQAVTSNGGSDNVDDTGIPATGGGALNYRIVINSSNQAEYWLSNPARGGRLELCVVRLVGSGLSGCIMYAGCICNVPASAPQMEWGNPIQGANL